MKEQNISKKLRNCYNDSYAVVIGINNYKDSNNITPLNYAVSDAKRVEDTLVDIGFSEDKIITLLNEKATKQKIQDVLKSYLPEVCSWEDRVLFYFSGHGTDHKISKNTKMGYLLPFDAAHEAIPSRSISMDEVREWSKIIPAKHILFALDCCYSGIAATRSTGVSSQHENYIEEVTEREVRQIITGGRKDQLTWETSNKGGIFTDELIKALDGRADLHNRGFVTGFDLGKYLENRVYEKSQQRQHPMFRYLSGDGEFIIFPGASKFHSEQFSEKTNQNQTQFAAQKDQTTDFTVDKKTEDFIRGSGSAEDPYIVKNAAQLDRVRKYKNSCFKLISDIDLNNLPGEKSWRPIGDFTDKFNGQLFGNGHIVKNLKVTEAGLERAGFFGCISEDGKIEKILFSSVIIEGEEELGVIAGLNEGRIKQCGVKEGRVKGEDLAGGLAGNNEGVISNSFFRGKIVSDWIAGGIAGVNLMGKIKNCFTVGEINGGNHGGNITGRGPGEISGCYYQEAGSQNFHLENEFDEFASGSSEMIRQESFAEWDFTSVWEINRKANHPVFKWQTDDIQRQETSANILEGNSSCQFNFEEKTNLYLQVPEYSGDERVLLLLFPRDDAGFHHKIDNLSVFEKGDDSFRLCEDEYPDKDNLQTRMIEEDLYIDEPKVAWENEEETIRNFSELIKKDRTIYPRSLYQIGDKKEFNVIDDSNKKIKIKAVLEEKREGVLVWVSEKNRNSVSQNAIEYFLDEFIGFRDKLKEYFGSEPTSDRFPVLKNGNNSLNILLYNMGESRAGYFHCIDLFTRNDYAKSNEAKIIYINMNPLRGVNQKGRNKIVSTIAHEYQHLLNFNARIKLDRGPERWLNEGFSQLAQDISGFGYKQGTIIPEVLKYLGNSREISLLNWEQKIENYGITYLFSRYLFDYYGKNIIKNIRSSPRAPRKIIENFSQTPADFKDIFIEFSLSVISAGLDQSAFAKFDNFNIDIDRPLSGPYIKPGNKIKGLEIKGWGLGCIYIPSGKGEDLHFELEGIPEAGNFYGIAVREDKY